MRNIIAITQVTLDGAGRRPVAPRRIRATGSPTEAGPCLLWTTP
jgi:hypothetical protein